jgi:cytochrome c
MADSLAFNKIAGAALATGLVIFGLGDLTRILFEQTPPAKPGYFIAVQEDTSSGGPVAEVIPDWGTVLPKADIAHGQALTAKCASCHQFDPAGTNSTGPGLYGVVGRPPGSHPGFTYSQPMLDFAKTHPAWTYDLLNQWLKAPGQFMPGTKMTFVGLPEVQDRIDVIAYLRSNGSPNYPIPAPKPATPAAGATNSTAPASNSAAAANATSPAANAVVAPTAAASTSPPATNAPASSQH